MVAEDFSFTSPVINCSGDRQLPGTAWQSDIALDNSKTYYWRVRAKNADSYSAWSATGAFITAPAPVKTMAPLPIIQSPTPLVVSTTPAIQTAESALPKWAVWLFGLGGLLLVMMVVLVVIMVVLLIKLYRSIR